MENREYVDIRNLESVRVSMEEAETTVNLSRTDNYIIIFCSDNTMLTKISKVAVKNIENWKCWVAGRNDSGNVCGYFFKAPKKALSFRSGGKRELTEDQREAASIRMRNGKAARRRGE